MKKLFFTIVLISFSGMQANPVIGTGSIGAGLSDPQQTISATKPIGPEEKGNNYAPGPVISPLKVTTWKVTMIKPLGTESNQLAKIAQNIVQKIDKAQSLQDLGVIVNDFAQELTTLKTTNKQAMQFLNQLGETLKNLMSQNKREIFVATTVLDRNLAQLLVLLQKENLIDLKNALTAVKKAYLKIATKKAKLALQEAAKKIGAMRDDVIINGLAALPVHKHDKETADLSKESIDLVTELKEAVKSERGKQDLQQLEQQIIEIKR